MRAFALSVPVVPAVLVFLSAPSRHKSPAGLAKVAHRKAPQAPCCPVKAGVCGLYLL
ncbi:hypothetical protein PR002_g25014 [Phytophthora rubi]|uniref:Uncharacterized protein n=1 Tax=Phytophthora rubi TaxID=129364 RepID=A0A6A3I5P6_9STRA|nr:hypothetical protein PR002_g25014 [Phytophthora rubi]